MPNELSCSRCHNSLSGGQKFCPACGKPIQTCANCAHFCTAEAVFCEKCGHSLFHKAGDSAMLPAATFAAPSIKQLYPCITVMCVDMKGSTSMIEDLDPEKARNLITPIFRIMLDVVHHHGGTVMRSGGDGLMAAFGAPQPKENHALQACSAALAIIQEVKLANAIIKLRIGLSSGQVLVEVVGDQQNLAYRTSGATVDIVQLMENSAEADTIQISDSTLKLVEGHVQATPLKEMRVPNHPEVHIYALKSLINSSQATMIHELLQSTSETSESKSQRKHATVLFVEIHDLPPTMALSFEETSQQRNEALKIILNVIYRYAGTVIHTSGNNAIVTFGAPQAEEDHALRACLAAFDMRNEVQAMAKSVALSIGLNSGKIFLEAQDEQHLEYEISGPVVNLAARMQQIAPPGSIQITRATYALVKDYVEAKHLGNLSIKGFKKSTEAFALQAINQGKEALEYKARPIYSSFIGRDLEIGLLNKMLLEAKRGRSGALNIAGTAGQGKSRLYYEFTQSEICKDCQKIFISGYLQTKNQFLHAVSHMFCEVLLGQYRDLKDHHQIIQHIQPLISKIGSPYALNAALALLGFQPADEEWNQLDSFFKHKYTFKTGIDILAQLSLQKPLIIVVEDVHFIDDDSVDFLDLLISNLNALNILLLMSCRVEFQDRWVNQPHYTRMLLNPLAKEFAMMMLDEILGDDSSLSDIKEKIVIDSGGTPFFIEELVKILIDTDVLTGTTHRYRINVKAFVDRIELPDTIYAALQMQLERLPPKQKKTLQYASVIGERFSYNLISQLMDIDQRELREITTVLCKGQYIYEKSIYPESEFSFISSLLVDVSYNNLLISKRIDLHARLLAIFEGLYPHPKPSEIQLMANHAFLGERWQSAFAYNLSAAKQAFMIEALKLSLHFFNQALLSANHLEQTKTLVEELVRIHLEISHAQIRLCRFAEQEEHLNSALELAGVCGNALLQSICYYFKAYNILATGSIADATEIANKTMNLVSTSDWKDVTLISKNFLSHLYLLSWQYNKLDEVAAELRRELPDIDYIPDLCRVPIWGLTDLLLSLARGLVGDFSQAVSDHKRWMPTMQSSKSKINMLFYHSGINWCVFCQGDYAQFHLKNMEEALEIENMMGIAMWASMCGCISLRQGKSVEGRKYIELAADIGKSMHYTFLLIFFMPVVCEGYFLLGEYIKTKELLDSAFDICQRRQVKFPIPALMRLSAMQALTAPAPDYAASVRELNRASEMAQNLGLWPEVAHIDLAKAQLYQQSAQNDQAMAALDKALNIYKKLEMPYWINAATIISAGMPVRSS